MILYLLRHGIAEDHSSRGSDASRMLTEEGKQKTRRALEVASAMRLATPTLIASSPLVRAIETADIACTTFAPQASRVVTDVLIPSADIDRTMSFIGSVIHEHSPIMLVGHEPHLSTLASALIGSAAPAVEMKKASLAMFEIYRLDAPRMRAVLTALLPPRIAELR